MKKSLGISTLAVLLAACSSPNDPAQVSQVTEASSLTKVEEALKACQESVGESKDQIKFDACMKEKGFERQAQQEQVVQQAQETVKENATAVKSEAKKAVKKVKSTKTK
ncbi:hypothetical protein [Actinobacillus pleuropneumoniae]|uniref:Secreted protein n=5 Tax=Actinobacillus pleuropneumoniae TaxID=715 RepID=A0A223MCG8_ACTPL|nr:hypothetical protein [Actinobacillus pleuropneumoniae]ABY69874.1 hypothetical protein APJL_1318 [Actinobacillus pleuropneumoniae serovar 3 str. JL03]ACE62008.1 putative secreted protein [Actinobacillus pleuropneumoniae serovar 7 str. AP76]ASU15136.1 hypothetical protein CHY23_00330 [Actinobacillus pleuropneumoniae]AWG95735.1 hypothetical protein APPSER1_07110 [Actinobacillus pleuropneumoniae serovar 1 str. 4074]AXA21805.1 hypothetical protein DRF63_07105 [Actinobacillus pleuropneumoniae]